MGAANLYLAVHGAWMKSFFVCPCECSQMSDVPANMVSGILQWSLAMLLSNFQLFFHGHGGGRFAAQWMAVDGLP